MINPEQIEFIEICRECPVPPPVELIDRKLSIKKIFMVDVSFISGKHRKFYGAEADAILSVVSPSRIAGSDIQTIRSEQEVRDELYATELTSVKNLIPIE